MSADAALRPAAVCRRLLAALDAAEGRRRSRKRDTTPDAIGLAIKRALLEEIVAADPDPEALEAWLLARCTAEATGEGAWRAMARDVLAEWRLAVESRDFGEWLARGAPSDDAGGESPRTDR
ncbi:MAG TPA: hypothetical protein VF406_09775 [Thermodesulfobacteriota bacterium]